jgi:hypothetical protein
MDRIAAEVSGKLSQFRVFRSVAREENLHGTFCPHPPDHL